jgi:hypothetical protein
MKKAMVVSLAKTTRQEKQHSHIKHIYLLVAAFFGGGGKYICDSCEVCGVAASDEDCWPLDDGCACSRSGRSEDVLSPPRRLKANVRGVYGEMAPPAAMGGIPGLKEANPGLKGYPGVGG